MRRTSSRRWLGAALAATLLAAVPAYAEFRWPWEKPDKEKRKQRQERVVPPATPTSGRSTTEASSAATPEDREMLPRLARFYEEQLDLTDEAVERAPTGEVRQLAERLNRDAERALGVIREHAREAKVTLRPHVRESLAERLRRQAGGRPANERWDAGAEVSFLDELLANIDEIRSDFAGYKSRHADKSFHAELTRLFDEELVPVHDQVKAVRDRIRNQTRTP